MVQLDALSPQMSVPLAASVRNGASGASIAVRRTSRGSSFTPPWALVSVKKFLYFCTSMSLPPSAWFWARVGQEHVL